MEIKTMNNGILLCGTENFDPEQTFNCGQCFRFEKIGENVFRGAALGRVLEISRRNGDFFFAEVSEREFYDKWYGYFDLRRDYKKIAAELSRSDPHMEKAAGMCGGIRILRQEFWETLCSFIISQNNNIPRIKKIIERLCEKAGDPIGGGYYSFPSAEKVYALGITGLDGIKSGFRAKYILDAAEKTASGTLDAAVLREIGYEAAKEKLKNVKGVGDKVADCVALFGLGYGRAFPADVWIKRALENHYGADFSPAVFGENAGLAQQYLFHYERAHLPAAIL